VISNTDWEEEVNFYFDVAVVLKEEQAFPNHYVVAFTLGCAGSKALVPSRCAGVVVPLPGRSIWCRLVWAVWLSCIPAWRHLDIESSPSVTSWTVQSPNLTSHPFS
jgi:hypothetical protein